MSAGNPTPFKPDVAYMEVPRCDRCQHWTNVKTVGWESDLGATYWSEGECAQLFTKPGEVVAVPQRLPLALARGPFVTKGHFGCVQFEERT